MLKTMTFPHLVTDGQVAQRLTLGPVVDPVEDLGVPEQAVLLLEHPVVLIGEVEEPGGNTAGLEDVEQAQAIALGQTVVEGVVDDELGSGPVGNVVLGVPLAVRVGVPDAAVVVVADEPEFLRGPCTLGVGDTVVGDEALELVAEVVGLDPVGHVTTVGSTGGDTVLGVYPWHAAVDVVPGVDQVVVWPATPLALDGVGEELSKTSGTSWVGCDNDVALVGPDLRVPAVGPAVAPVTLRTTMDIESERVGYVLLPESRLDNVGLKLLLELRVGTVEEDLGNGVGSETSEVGVDLRRVEEGLLLSVCKDVPLAWSPDGGSSDEQRTIRKEGESRDGCVRGHRLGDEALVGIDRKVEDLDASVVISSDVDGGVVVSPGDGSLNPAVKAGTQSLPVADSYTGTLNSDVDSVELPPVRLVVVLILLHVGELAAVGGEGWEARGTLVTSLRRGRFWAVEGDGSVGRRESTNIGV